LERGTLRVVLGFARAVAVNITVAASVTVAQSLIVALFFAQDLGDNIAQ
jgi:hypothetical protein